jgi:hypothetical protein
VGGVRQDAADHEPQGLRSWFSESSYKEEDFVEALRKANAARDRFLGLAHKELQVKGRSAGFRDLEAVALAMRYRTRRRHPRSAEEKLATPCESVEGVAKSTGLDVEG